MADNIPFNISILKEIFGQIIYCLNLFHFVERIVETLLKGHVNYVEAFRALSNYLSTDNKTHFDAVKSVMKAGLLGG